MDKNNQLKDKQIVFITVLVVILLIAGFIFGGIRPVLNNVYKAKDEFEMSKMEMEMMKEDAMKLQQYDNLTHELALNKDLIDSALINKESLVIFIESLEKISAETGNSLSIATYQPPKKKATTQSDGNETKQNESTQQDKDQKEDKNKQYLQLKTEGDYRGFLKFLYKLENMAQSFQIDSINMKIIKNRYDKEGEENSNANKILESSIIISFSLEN